MGEEPQRGLSGAEDRRGPTGTILVTLTGQDRPGITTGLFEALDRSGVAGLAVLDVEQVLVRGYLTLAVLLRAGDGERAVAGAVGAYAVTEGLDVRLLPGPVEAPGRSGGLHVTLMAPVLRPRAVSEVTALLAERGANIDRVRRLSADPVTTLELDVSGVADLPSLRRELAAAAAGLGVDVAASPAGLARQGRRLVVLDVDSTLIQDEVIELLAERAGAREAVARVTEQAMRGELDFAESLRARVATLAGLPESVFADVGRDVRLTPGAPVLVRTLQRLGWTVAVVSGGFHQVVDPLAASLGIRHVRANRLEVEGGRLTGRVTGAVVDRAAKASALRDFAAAEGLPLSRTVAVGDGANDLDMLAAAGLGVAFNAKPLVREQADAAVTVPWLDSVLFLLGVSGDDIAEAGAE